MSPSILDRYILREFLLSFAAVMAFCTLLMLVGAIFTKFADILAHDVPWTTVAMYFITSLPARVMFVVPIAAMLGVLFSVGGLARTNEVLAMLTSGIHGLRLSVPIMVCGSLIVIGTFIMNEYVVPPLERMAQNYELMIEEKDIAYATAEKSFITRGRDNWFYLARLYTRHNQKMSKPTIITLNDDHTNLVQRIEAKSARLVENRPEEKQSLWAMEYPMTWKLDNGEITTFTSHATTVTMSLEEDLNKVLNQRQKPEEMNFHQMQERIEILSERQQPVRALQTDLMRKLTFPLGILAIMLIGFGYGVKARPGTAVSIFGYGITWALVYYVINAVTQALGHSGKLSPFSAMVVPTLGFFIAGIYYLRRSYRWHS